MNTGDTVHVVVSGDGEVLGVASGMGYIQTGKTPGLRVLNFKLNGMNRCGVNERPFVVYFKDADEDRPQVWPIKGEFPPTKMEAMPEGIECVVYARDACEALAEIFGRMHFDSWEILKSDWQQLHRN